MTPEDVAARLDERFRLLRGSRSSAGRHEALVSTIDWSYQLLDEEQKLLLQRLSVFAGAFPLVAAERICADEQLDELDILDIADELVDHSLLIADTSGATTHYRMLEMIREYGRGQLGDGIGALRDRHLRYHAGWVEEILNRMVTVDEPAALRELEAGWSDLRTAAAHATADLDVLARMLVALGYDAFFRSRLELAEWASTALAVADEEATSDQTRASLLAVAAGLVGLAGDGERAVTYATALCDLCDLTGAGLAQEASSVAVAGALLSGRPDLSVRIQDIAERSMPEDAPAWRMAMSAAFRAIAATYNGDAEVAAEAVARALAAKPRDLSPSMSALIGWMAAVHSTAPRAQVAAAMEQVIAEASLVTSAFLQAVFSQVLSSIHGELGELAQPMSDAADNLDSLLATVGLGLASASVRRAAVLLIKAGEHDSAATLLGWVESSEHSVPATPDLAAEMTTLVPAMREALGDVAADAAAAAGARLTPGDALALGSGALRRAAG